MNAKLILGFLALILLFSNLCQSQTTIFRERFNGPPFPAEGNGAISGSSEQGIAWSTNCVGCVLIPPNQYFEVRAGWFEHRWANGVGEWITTDPIDVSNSNKLLFSVIYNSSLSWAGTGNMDSNTDCPSGGGCAGDIESPTAGGCIFCWDFINVQLIVDGTTVYSETVGNGNNVQNYTFTYESPCVEPGTYSNAVIRIRATTWATDERIRFDDVHLRSLEPTVSASPFSDICETASSISLTGGMPAGGTWSGLGVFANTFNPSIAGPGVHELIYTVTISGCPFQDTTQIEVIEATDPTFTPTPSYCAGDPIPDLPTTSNNGYTGTWSPAIDNTTTTTYTFTPTSGLCASTTTLAITVNQPTLPTFTPPPSYCAGTAIPALPTTSLNGINGTWSPAIDNTMTTTYTFTPTNGQCASPTTLSITINQPTIPNFTATPSYCAGAAIPALPTTSLNGVNGTWSPAIDNTMTTTYTFTPTAGQCASTTTLSITIDPQTVPNFGPLGPFCQNSTPPVLVTTSPNMVNGTWSPPAINTNVTGSSSYIFTPDIGQCASGQTISILINTLPSVSVNPAGPLCTIDAAITLTGSPAGGTWTGTGVSGNSFDPAAAGSGNWLITYSFTDGNGCSNTANTSILVSDCGCLNPIMVDAGPDQQICANEIPIVSGTVVNSAIFTWTTSGDGTFDDPSVLTTNYNPGPLDIAGGTVTITLTAPDPDGAGPCSSVDDFFILDIVQQPTITISGNIDLCLNECGTFPILITGGTGGTYQLSLNITDGTFNYNFMDPSITNGENINVCYGGATSSYNAVTNTLNIPNTVSQGDFIISATLIVDNNFTTCQGIINPPNTVTVSINSNPSITLSGTAGLCPGECENVSFNISGGSGLYNVDFLITSPFFGYNFSDNALSASNNFTFCYSGLFPSYNAATNTITIPSFVPPGVLNITVTSLEDANTGCPGTINIPNNLGITLYTNPVVSVTPVPTQCLNDPAVTLSGSPAGGIWSGTGVIGNTFDPLLAGVGSWQVTYKYTDVNGCMGSSSTSIVVSDCGCANPAIADAGMDLIICNGDDAALTGSVSSTAIWSTNGSGIFANPISAITTYTPSTADFLAGTVTLTLTATDPDGAGPCSSANDQIVLTFTTVVVNIDPVADICLTDGPITLSATPPGGIWTGTGVTGNTFDPSVAGVGTTQLIYEYTDANDCSDAETLAILVLDCGCADPAFANAGPDDIVCAGDAAILSGTANHAGTWTTSGSGTFSNINDVNTTYTPSQADINFGSVILTLTDADPDGIGPCVSADDQVVITFDFLVINISPVSQLCDGDPSVILSATPTGGLWSGNGVTGNSFDPSTAGPGTHTINYTFTNSNNCTANEDIQIVVTDCNCPNPAMVNAGSDLKVCGNQLILLNGTVNTSPLWSTNGTGFFDDPNMALTIYNASPADILAGSVTLTLTASDPDGAGPCSAATDQTVITFQAMLSVVANPVNDLCISASPVTLTGNPGGGTWSGIGVTGNTFDPAIAGIGSFTLSYDVSSGGCDGSDDIVVNVIDLPAVSIGTLADFCIGDPAIVLNIGSPAGGSYYLNGDLVNAITSFNPSMIGTQTITYIVGTSPCTNQAITSFKVNDCACPNQATSDAGIDQAACKGSTFSLVGIISNANSATWTTAGDGIFGNANSLNTSYAPGLNDVLNGSVIITLTTEDPDGIGPCNPASNTMKITINTPPVIVFQSVADLCLDDLPITLTVTPTGGIFTGNGISGNQFDPMIAGVGTHKIFYKANVGTCVSIDSITINVANCDCTNNVTVNVGPDTTICQLNPVQLNPIISGIANGSWTTNGSGNFNNSNIKNAIYTPSPQDLLNGTIVVTYTTVDPDGAGPCLSATDQKNIILKPQPEVLLLVTQPSCNKPLGSLKITVLAGQNLLYSIDNGLTFTANLSIDNIEPNDYQLIIQSPGFDCQTTLDFKIATLPISEAFWTIKSSACSDDDNNSFVLYQTSNLTLPYQITINGEKKSPVTSLPATFEMLDFGIYDVILTDSKGCIVTKQIEFKFNSSVELNINPIYIIDKGESVVLKTDILGDYETISWTPATWLSCDDCPDPTAKPDSNVTYKVVVMDSQGCMDEGIIEVRIRKKINVFIPNVISPNHDGINDGFTVFADENIKSVKTLRIFNRWGGLVFERNNFEPNKEELGWNGTFKGKEENPMVFVYFVEVELTDGDIKIFKGDVTVIK